MQQMTDTIEQPLTYHMDLGKVREQMNAPAGNAVRNLADPERWASMVGGGALAAYGLSRRTPLGVGLALLGGVLMHRGSTGHCSVYEKLGISTR